MSYLCCLYLFTCSGVQYILCCALFCFPLSYVHYDASFCGLSIFDCPFGIPYCLPLFTQFRPDFFKFSMKQRPELFSNFGWPDYLFYLRKGHNYSFQNKKNVFSLLNMSLVTWLEGGASLPRPLASVIFDPKLRPCILIIIHTVYTCDTLVPTRILNSEISWFCFDFPKWGQCFCPVFRIN